MRRPKHGVSVIDARSSEQLRSAAAALRSQAAEALERAKVACAEKDREAQLLEERAAGLEAERDEWERAATFAGWVDEAANRFASTVIEFDGAIGASLRAEEHLVSVQARRDEAAADAERLREALDGLLESDADLEALRAAEADVVAAERLVPLVDQQLHRAGSELARADTAVQTSLDGLDSAESDLLKLDPGADVSSAVVVRERWAVEVDRRDAPARAIRQAAAAEEAEVDARRQALLAASRRYEEARLVGVRAQIQAQDWAGVKFGGPGL